MQLFDVCTRVVYDREGKARVKWYPVGIVKITNTGTMFLRLYQQPTTDFFLFEKGTRAKNKLTSEVDSEEPTLQPPEKEQL